MSGHSKWANIKAYKVAQVEKKGKVYSKLARDIMVVFKRGAGFGLAAAEALRNLGFDFKKSRDADSSATQEKPAATLDDQVIHALCILHPS